MYKSPLVPGVDFCSSSLVAPGVGVSERILPLPTFSRFLKLLHESTFRKAEDLVLSSCQRELFALYQNYIFISSRTIDASE